MKTAITISGASRSIEYTFDNIKENLFNQFPDCDVFVHVAKNKKSDVAEKLFSTLDNVTLNVVEEKDVDLTGVVYQPGWLDGHVHKDGSRPTEQTIAKMYKARSHLFDMVTQAEKEKNIKYDRIIYSRDDVHYLKPVSSLIEPLDMSKLWLPHFHHWLDGYCDRFAVSNKKYMHLYMNIVKYFKEYCESGHVIHSETTHRFHLDRVIGREDIKTFHIEIARVRSDGSVEDEGFPDPPAVRWQ